MKTGMTLLNAGVAAQEALNIIGKAVDKARDLTPAEAHEVVRYSVKLHCQALELERMAMGIPAPKRG